MTEEIAEELFRQVAAFASFGFAKSHAAAFARTAYESSFLKLFYPAQFLVGLINAQPMGFYPVEVLVNDAKRHGVAVLPVDVNRSTLQDDDRVGRAAGLGDRARGRWPGEPLPDDAGIERRPAPVRSSGCVIPSDEARERWAAESAVGWGVRLGLRLVKGIGEEHEELLDAELARGPYRSLADVVERTGLPEETLERLIRVGALDSLGRPRRELLWQLREVAGASRGRLDGRSTRGGAFTRAASRPMALRLPPTEAPTLPGLTESERIGDAYAVIGLDARRQVVGLYRPALDRLGAVTNAALSDRRPGRGPDRWARRHPPASDDRQGHGLPRPRGRDRDGQRHALAGHLGAAPGRRPPPRAAPGRRRPPARVVGRERDRARCPAARRGRRDRRRSGSARRRAPARARPGCAAWADCRRVERFPSQRGRDSCFFGTLPSGRRPLAAALRRPRPVRARRLRNRRYQAAAAAKNAPDRHAHEQRLAQDQPRRRVTRQRSAGRRVREDVEDPPNEPVRRQSPGSRPMRGPPDRRPASSRVGRRSRR